MSYMDIHAGQRILFSDLEQFGSKSSENSRFEIATSISTDSEGNLFVTDTGNNRIQKFSNTGTFLTKWGKQGSTNNRVNSPYGIAVDADNKVYVADSENHRNVIFSYIPLIHL